MRRQDQRRVVGELKDFAAKCRALRRASPRSRRGSAQGSTTTPLPMIDSLSGPHDARGQQAELVFDIADDERVAGIVAALKAHHDIGALRQPVDDLALALVAPLGADDGDIAHLAPPSAQRHRIRRPSRTWLQPRRRASARQSPTGSSAATVIQPARANALARARSVPSGSSRRRGRERIRQGPQNGVGIEREAGRRLRRRRIAGLDSGRRGRARRMNHAPRAAGEKRKADPGVILETAVLDRIDGDLELGRRRCEPVEHGAEPRALGARPLRQIEAVERSERRRRGARGREQPTPAVCRPRRQSPRPRPRPCGRGRRATPPRARRRCHRPRRSPAPRSAE